MQDVLLTTPCWMVEVLTESLNKKTFSLELKFELSAFLFQRLCKELDDIGIFIYLYICFIRYRITPD